MDSHVSRKRSYRHRVRCEKCQKELNADNKAYHIKAKHNGQNVKFTTVQDTKQRRLYFELSSPTISNSEDKLMSSVDVSVPIENVSEIEPIIDTVPHFPTVTKKENTLGKTVSNSEHQLISSVNHLSL